MNLEVWLSMWPILGMMSKPKRIRSMVCLVLRMAYFVKMVPREYYETYQYESRGETSPSYVYLRLVPLVHALVFTLCLD